MDNREPRQVGVYRLKPAFSSIQKPVDKNTIHETFVTQTEWLHQPSSRLLCICLIYFWLPLKNIKKLHCKIKLWGYEDMSHFQLTLKKDATDKLVEAGQTLLLSAGVKKLWLQNPSLIPFRIPWMGTWWHFECMITSLAHLICYFTKNIGPQWNYPAVSLGKSSRPFRNNSLDSIIL